MRAALFCGPWDIQVGDRPDPVVTAPTDAVVRVVLGCVCGSDLWYYRGETRHKRGPIGHEFIGYVEQVGSDVHGVHVGDLVIAPFLFSDGSCAHCRAGWPSSCVNVGAFGDGTIDGGQGEAVRVPFAGSTLVPVPGSKHPDEVLRSLLTLSDVMCTGHHAAVRAGVMAGSIVAVVGDGAVGLCGVIAARRLGADRIIALSRHADRQKLARAFGATDVVATRGDEAIDTVRRMTDDVGVDATLECVGTRDAMATAYAIARPGSTIGFVGIPHSVEVPIDTMFYDNVGLRGGVAPARVYIRELLDDVLEGRIDPGRVFDLEVDLDGVPEAYRAMHERRAIKPLIRLSGA